MTSEKLSGLAAVSMDGTGKALASAFDAVRDSFASTTASLSAFLSAAYNKMKNKKPSPSDLVKLAILSSEERM